MKSKNEEINKLTRKDLKFDSPYNTYLHYGLPIGPISNPGKESILAVIRPSKTNFLFFLADDLGGHDFSENYNEHLNKIKRYNK